MNHATHNAIVSFIDDRSEMPVCSRVGREWSRAKRVKYRDLRGTVEREQAAMGVSITLEPATAAMEKEAVSAGFDHSPDWAPRLSQDSDFDDCRSASRQEGSEDAANKDDTQAGAEGEAGRG